MSSDQKEEANLRSLLGLLLKYLNHMTSDQKKKPAQSPLPLPPPRLNSLSPPPWSPPTAAPAAVLMSCPTGCRLTR